MRRWGVWLGLGVGCGSKGADDDSATSGGPRTEADLVTMSAWTWGDPAVGADPVPEHAPAETVCPEVGAAVEGASFEVRTGSCNYGWFQQPAQTDLQPGDEVELVFWHATLVSDDPGAQGHVAVFVEDALLFERTVDIPSDPMAYTERVVVAFAADVGALVTLHLHNHGANDWNLLRIERQATE